MSVATKFNGGRWLTLDRGKHPEVCNDRHSHLNRTRVLGRLVPRTLDDVVEIVRSVRERGESLGVAGACHAMGGQQFARESWLLDARGMNQVSGFDRERGIIEVQAGITWPELMRHYVIDQRNDRTSWGI